MKRLLWVMVALCTCLGLTTGASAAPLLIDENFSYTAGTLLTANGWTNHSGTTNYIPVTSSGLSYSGYPSSGIGNAASMLTSGEDVNRTYANQTSGSVYYAFMANVSAAQATGDYFTHLGTNTWTTTYPGRVFCRSAAGGVNFGISRAGSGTAVIWASGVYALNTTHLLVVKYTFVAGAANDLVDLFVNPTPCSGEPSPTVSAGVETGAEPSTGIGGVGLRQGSATAAPTLWIDGLRIGTTWLDAVCGAAATGACCYGDGSCAAQTQAACIAAGGAYGGDGTSCSPNPCPQLGTCCAGDGTCTFVLQANCVGAWTVGGACSPNPCTQPVGSCCALDGTCTVTTQANCTATWTSGGVCVPNTCAQPTGSCCYPDGTCAVTLLVDCTGTWTMFGVCVPNTCPQPTGACCPPSGSCTVGTAADCAAVSGVYQGDGTTCSPNPCPASLLLDEPFDYVAGTLLTANGWTNHSGTTNFIPVSSSGLSYPGYPSSGIGNAASMLPTGEDVNRTFANQTSGSVYYGFMVNVSAATATGDYFTHFGTNGWTTTFPGRVFCRSTTGGVNFGVSRAGAGTAVIWSSNVYALDATHVVVLKYTIVAGAANDLVDLFVNPTCPSEPAPTVSAGVETSAEPTTGIGGVGLRQGGATTGSTQWIDGLRVGTTWSDVVCGPATPGACCAADGTCSVQTQADCLAAGGAFYGGGTGCSPNPCPQLGTCCALDGTCTFVLQANCTGAWTGGGACSPNPCTQQIGSCCALDGTCTVTTQANCAATWTQGGVCVPNTCAQPTGSCCVPDGTCSVTLLADCTGNWTMFGVCVPNTCPQPTGACCLPSGGLCSVGTAADCAAASGTYQGNSTTCTPNPCPAPVKTLCEVAEDDVNGVALLVGQHVTVQGIALVNGMQWSTTIREFQITDGTCCIDVFGGTLLPTVAIGDLVQITGTVANYNGKTEITTPDLIVTVISSGNPIPTPGVTTTGALAAAGEAFESCLFTINCASIVSGTWPLAGADANIVIDDGTGPVTMRIDKDTDIDGSTAPVGPFTITGIGDQYDTTSPYTTGWQIKPRSLADLAFNCATGACCFPSGACLVMNGAACASQNGTYSGDDTNCTPNNCPPPIGACCFPDGSCQMLAEVPCADGGGLWLTYGSICAPNPCEQPLGSCCYPDGSCIVMIQSACTGDWTVAGICDPNPCGAAGVDGGELDSVLGVRANPNPFAGKVSLRVAGPNATAARVLIFDATGRLVRTAWNGMLNGRAFTVTWDGRDDSGREAATGIYMVRLESGSGNVMGRLVKLR